jgi:NAD(P)-dependent dehydrogenase (short-subunit alcohol dehydrogenase family)
MDLKLQGKYALVSGSTAGIGLAIAQALTQEGASVIVNGRTEQRVDEAIAKIKSSNSHFQDLRPSSLIKRFVTNEEVTNLVIYLSSPLASATNGAALRVDGRVVRSII